MATAPSLGAGIVDNDPKKLPIGVLAAETITTCLLIISDFFVLSKINQILQEYRTNQILGLRTLDNIFITFETLNVINERPCKFLL